MASLTTEVKSDAKLLGYFEYRSGIIACVILLLIAIGLAITLFEEEKQPLYIMLAIFNMMCLGLTYVMRGRLDVRAQERAE